MATNPSEIKATQAELAQAEAHHVDVEGTLLKARAELAQAEERVASAWTPFVSAQEQQVRGQNGVALTDLRRALTNASLDRDGYAGLVLKLEGDHAEAEKAVHDAQKAVRQAELTQRWHTLAEVQGKSLDRLVHDLRGLHTSMNKIEKASREQERIAAELGHPVGRYENLRRVVLQTLASWVLLRHFPEWRPTASAADAWLQHGSIPAKELKKRWPFCRPLDEVAGGPPGDDTPEPEMVAVASEELDAEPEGDDARQEALPDGSDPELAAELRHEGLL